MSHKPSSVANFLLDSAERDANSITPLKLQKIVYMAYGWSLAILNQPLIDEIVEAWRYGPVIATLYNKFKAYGNDPITALARTFNGKENIDVPSPTSKDTIALLNKVWEVYGEFPAYQLANMTHEPDTPWAKIYSPNQRNREIPDDMIRDYFLLKIEKQKN